MLPPSASQSLRHVGSSPSMSVPHRWPRSQSCEPSRTLVADLLASPRVNAYTIEKRGARKVIYQAPWFDAGAFAGLVELSLEVPAAMPHFVREG